MVSTPSWSPDISLPDFEMMRLDFAPDYEGAVHATLVRRNAKTPAQKAVLYIHGFMDYFFQVHLAEAYNQHGFNFYALDLRKYGRSLAEHQHPNFCKDLTEYFEEISASLQIISEQDENDWILLSGHSTGGLTSSLYTADGEYRHLVKALFLNSPFFDWNLTGFDLRALQGLAAVGGLFPFIPHKQAGESPYMQSILKDHHGEWDMDLRWRPLDSFPVFSGWCRAINRGHQRLRQGLNLSIPVMLMYSDKSIYGDTWTQKFQTGDAVLDVEHIRDGAQYLGSSVQTREIVDGLHDLV